MRPVEVCTQGRGLIHTLMVLALARLWVGLETTLNGGALVMRSGLGHQSEQSQAKCEARRTNLPTSG